MEYQECVKQYKSDRREAMILVAGECFMDRGIEPVKMTDIAEHCGIGVASLYRYFGTKTSIVIAVGEKLWKDVELLFEGVYECDSFTEKNGREQIKDLMKYIPVLFASHKEFLRFIADFDIFVLSNHVQKEELKGYEESIMNFYPLCMRSFEKGKADGSVRKDVDGRAVYLTVSHALLSMGQKFLRGEILSGDDFTNAEAELDLLIEMAIRYISTDK